jgi:hypothetical protein
VSFFTMKLLRGRALASLLRERGVLSPSEVRRLLREVGGALAYAARQGVVHRDIKPDNIMLDDDGRFIVTDFGIARSAAAPRLTATGMSVGTPRYMSPEQARAKPVDGRSDMYSLGVVAYQCLTGRVPFDGDEAFAILYSHIHSPVPRPALSNDDEWELFDLIERMLAKKPGDRVQDGGELVRLVDVLEQRTRASAAEGTVGRPLLATAAVTRLSARKRLGRAWSLARAGYARIIGRASSVPALRWAAARPRAAALAAVAGTLILVGVQRAVHAAIHHESRCPAATLAGSLTTDAWSVLLDTPATPERGDAVLLHYDVCGLERDAAYAVELTIDRSNAIRRLLGGSPSVEARWDERASGPSTRRHRRVDLEDLAPGTYAVELEVTHVSGARRRVSREMRIED